MNNQSFTSHPVYDNEDQIVSAGNTPSPVSLRTFQRQIDRIVGKSLDGKSRLRIVWGQDQEKTKMWVMGFWSMQYPFYYRADKSVIGLPRFIVEELHTNSELHKDDAWEKARYEWDGINKVDVLGPPPEGGFYTRLFEIAHHDDRCCGGVGAIKHPEHGILECHGAYREPNQTDLDRIQRMLQRKDQASNEEVNPSEDTIRRRAKEMQEARNEQWTKQTRDSIEDFFRTHGWRFTEQDPTTLAHGKYQFMGGHSKSGISKEDLRKARGEMSPGEEWTHDMSKGALNDEAIRAMARMEYERLSADVTKSPIQNDSKSEGERPKK